ncbi:nucleotide pyrophosphohydrolase [Geodermatophilus sp. SYSU D00691]
MADLDDLTTRMREFTEARDWGRFHDLKSLTLALTGEVGEVAELVQWLPADASVGDALRDRLGEELADVLLYLVRLADVAGVDLAAAALPRQDLFECRARAALTRVPPRVGRIAGFSRPEAGGEGVGVAVDRGERLVGERELQTTFGLAVAIRSRSSSGVRTMSISSAPRG